MSEEGSGTRSASSLVGLRARVTRAPREIVRAVATRGALLYFLITDMAAINPMYQVSLQQFLALFDESIERAAPAPLASKRIVNIVECNSGWFVQHDFP